MANSNTNDSTNMLPQPPLEERVAKIEQAVDRLLTGQGQIITLINSLTQEVCSLTQDTKERYVDLRTRIALNHDKLDVIQRELYLLVKDTRDPHF